MQFSNTMMLSLATEQGRQHLIDPGARALILGAQWALRPPSIPELHVSRVELAATHEGACIDVLLTGHLEVVEGAAPQDPFSDPGFREASTLELAKPDIYPFQLALLVCETPIDLRELLYKGKAILAALARGAEAAPAAAARQAVRQALVGLVVPGAVFDDDHWPGTERVTGSKTRRREQRLEFVNAHLIEEGVFGVLGSSPPRR